MSLEQELARNTEAVIALTAALTARTVVVEAPTEKMSQALAKVKPPKLVAVSDTPVEVPVSPPDTATTTASETSATTPTIDYATVAKAITDTFKVDRVKTIEALAKFGAAKGPQLKPEDYAAFLAELAA